MVDSPLCNVLYVCSTHSLNNSGLPASEGVTLLCGSGGLNYSVLKLDVIHLVVGGTIPVATVGVPSNGIAILGCGSGESVGLNVSCKIGGFNGKGITAVGLKRECAQIYGGHGSRITGSNADNLDVVGVGRDCVKICNFHGASCIGVNLNHTVGVTQFNLSIVNRINNGDADCLGSFLIISSTRKRKGNGYRTGCLNRGSSVRNNVGRTDLNGKLIQKLSRDRIVKSSADCRLSDLAFFICRDVADSSVINGDNAVRSAIYELHVNVSKDLGETVAFCPDDLDLFNGGVADITIIGAANLRKFILECAAFGERLAFAGIIASYLILLIILIPQLLPRGKSCRERRTGINKCIEYCLLNSILLRGDTLAEVVGNLNGRSLGAVVHDELLGLIVNGNSYIFGTNGDNTARITCAGARNGNGRRELEIVFIGGDNNTKVRCIAFQQVRTLAQRICATVQFVNFNDPNGVCRQSLAGERYFDGAGCNIFRSYLSRLGRAQLDGILTVDGSRPCVIRITGSRKGKGDVVVILCAFGKRGGYGNTGGVAFKYYLNGRKCVINQLPSVTVALFIVVSSVLSLKTSF